MATVAVVGEGGREHALAWGVARSAEVSRVFCNGVVTQHADKITPYPAEAPAAKDQSAFAKWAKEAGVALVIVGPEQPLVDGLVDVLIAAGVNAFGPTKASAQLEGSKEFAHQFMERHGIPTSRWQAFTAVDPACAFIDAAPFPALVVKACGLAAGKGVVVAANAEEAKAAVRDVLDNRVFGDAGSMVVIEELLVGPEVSLFAMTDGKTVAAFPPAQDHKRLLDNDLGPNTGGMGAYAPVPEAIASKEDVARVIAEVAAPTVAGMAADGTPYHGLLYCQVMLTPSGPRVVEFNARFGDPETQALMMLLESDLYTAMLACSPLSGSQLADCPLTFAQGMSAACVVQASQGYPSTYPKGKVITGLSTAAALENTLVFHAGTKRSDSGEVVTSGGRVLAVAAARDSLGAAVKAAYAGTKVVNFEGVQYRNDIAWQATAPKKAGLTYADAGVSISTGDALVSRIKPACKSTRRVGCDAAIGGFGGLFDLKAAGFKDPILVSGTDGVGTKLEIAKQAGLHSSIGIDLVAMCVNDILAHGAEPLFFLDYLATSKLELEQASQVVEGIAAGCLQAGCALVGGETAEMPGMYGPGDYDVAGFAVGAVERDRMLPLSGMAPGDVILGLGSSGVHSNGYSLVRRVVRDAGMDYMGPVPFESDKQTLGAALLTPTKIYVKALLPPMTEGLIKAFAHITGGGLADNIVRVLPPGIAAEIDAATWPMPAVFPWLQAQGNIAPEEMSRTFNCGLGAVVVVSPAHADKVLAHCAEKGEVVNRVGTIVAETPGAPHRVTVANLDTAFRGAAAPTPAPIALTPTRRVRTAVLISGSGTNLQSLINAAAESGYPAEIVAVVSNVAGVKGLERAAAAGIGSFVVDHKKYPNREAFEAQVNTILDDAGVEVVCLAGFMRIVTASFAAKWAGKLLNIHPALLPSFPGMHAQRQALESGARVTGCTVHFVDAGVDTGAIIAQDAVCVEDGDSEATLSDRIKAAEHVLYPRALALVASGAVSLGADGKAVRQ